jgi:hypothetical protein
MVIHKIHKLAISHEDMTEHEFFSEEEATGNRKTHV